MGPCLVEGVCVVKAGMYGERDVRAWEKNASRQYPSYWNAFLYFTVSALVFGSLGKCKNEIM